MKRFLWSDFLCGLLNVSLAQQFRITDYNGENLTIEYPPSFDGAYLFVEKKTNLTEGVWEAVDYSQITLVKGDPVSYTPPATNGGSASSSTTNVPYIITSEYLEAVAAGEVENTEWTAGSLLSAPQNGVKAFFRIVGLSFVDSDGDGVDNVSEYGLGTDPYISDSSTVTLPADDGDPQPVPGSVDSAPGDWNTPSLADYRATTGYHGAINKLILALDGTNGTFTASNTVAQLGAWVEAQCGAWTAPKTDEIYPTVTGGRFYRTETNGFAWAGLENIYALSFHPYNGSEQFINHLVQSATNDPAGLASLPGGTPVLMNATDSWTPEKLAACLKVLITVPCRVQRIIGSGETATHDSSDSTYLAQSVFQHYQRTPYPAGAVEDPYNYTWLNFIYQSGVWNFSDVAGDTLNQHFEFSDKLRAHGFGPTIHRGYVKVRPPHDWMIDGWWDKYSLLSPMPQSVTPGVVSKTLTATDGESGWFMAAESNYCESAQLASVYDWPAYSPPSLATHWTGFFCDDAEMLSTLSPPPLPEAATLTMDYDRDGIIATNDVDRFDTAHPYRFWVNEDGNAATYPEADLEDFFPAKISWPEGAGQPNITFKLSANVDLNYIPTSMSLTGTDEYLTDLSVAQTLASGIQTLSSGSQTSETFSENDTVLLAASSGNTNAQIYVHILQNGSEIAVSTNYFSFSSVTNMYRTKNLRSGDGSSLDEPSNWPDNLTNGRDFVFVHGYNVDDAAGRQWNSTIFKRLWHSGSNARFHGILWDGTPNTETWFDLGPYHYHNAVIHAFATAPDFATYLSGLNEPVVAAHSLGNMLTSEAIAGNHGLSTYDVKQYYALDAAVALEAYGDVSPDEALVADNWFDRMDEGLFSDLIPFWSDINEYDWKDYPYLSWSSEWYRLFTNNVSDARADLTWRHRFADIQDKTDAFNFYSSTEEVLRIDTNFVSFISGASTKYVWQIQEHFKGRLNGSFITGIYDSLGGAASEYCGWGFTEEADSAHIYDTWGVIAWAPVRPRNLHETLANENPDQEENLHDLAVDPLFRPKPVELFGASAAAFAGGTVASHGGSLDYNTSNDTYPIDDVLMTDWLLVKAFPSRTGPMGSSAVDNIGGGWVDVNFNMSSSVFLNPTTGFFSGENKDEWHHNDIREAPYIYVYKLFDKLTE